jgi:hypothetical protein
MFSAGISKQKAAAATNVDPQFNYVTALLHGDGTNGAQNNTFLDSSGSGFAITRGGTATQGTFSPYGTGWSWYLNGSSQNIAIPSSSQVTLGTNSFTFEGWVYVSGAVNTYGVFVQSASSSYFPQSTTNTVALGTSSSNWQIYCNNTSYVSTATWSPGNWYHYAVVRSGTTTQLYINGTSIITVTGDSTNYSGTYLGYGNIYGTIYYLNGYLSNCRLVNGTAVYTSNFTPPNSPLTAITNTALLICQSNRFVDNSVNNFSITPTGTVAVQRFNPFLPTSTQQYSPTVTGGSVYLGGSDYIQNGNISAPLGAGDFTLECWIYPTSTAATNKIIYGWRNGADTSPYLLLNSTNVPQFGGDITNYLVSSKAITVNAWNHIACVRTGTSMVMYLNGSSVATATSSQNFTWNSGIDVGVINGANPYYFSGYITDLRVVAGTSVYNQAFTPPTAPLATSQTASSNGSPSNALTAPIANSSQVIFNGSNQSLNLGGQAAFAFGVGSFTIEMWIYIKTASQTAFLYDSRNTNNTTQAVLYLSGGAIAYAVGATGAITGASPSINTWHHIAVVRNLTSTVLYLDGVQTGSTYTDATNYTNDASRPIIGNGGYASGNYFNGYMTNLRVVKGTAVYTSAFTPPTSPLTAITNTSLLTCQNPTIVDNSGSALTITNNNTALTSLAIGPFGGTYAGVFNGSSQYLSVASNAAFGYGTGDFTIEMFVYLTTISGSTPNLLDQRNATSTQVVPTFYVNAGVLSYYVNGTTVWTGATLTANTWYHLAISRSTGVTKFFVNGIQSGASYTDANNYISSPLRLFASNDGGTTVYQAGYLSNLRIVKGTALYTSNFFPPQGPLTAVTGTQLLTCQNSTFIDNSSNAFTITNTGSATLTNSNGPFGNATTPQLLLNNTNAGVLDNAMIGDYITVGSAQISSTQVKYGTGSIKFNGTTDYLSIPSNVSFAFGSGNVTIEAWVYLNAYNSGAQCRFFYPSTNNENIDIGGSTNSPGKLSYFNGTSGINSSAGVVPLNQWTHVAYVRNGTTVTFYVNGSSVASGTLSAPNNTSALSFNIGGDSTGNYLNGYIDDYRITKGYARYTSNFTPPTAALPNYGR